MNFKVFSCLAIFTLLFTGLSSTFTPTTHAINFMDFLSTPEFSQANGVAQNDSIGSPDGLDININNLNQYDRFNTSEYQNAPEYDPKNPNAYLEATAGDFEKYVTTNGNLLSGITSFDTQLSKEDAQARYNKERASCKAKDYACNTLALNRYSEATSVNNFNNLGRQTAPEDDNSTCMLFCNTVSFEAVDTANAHTGNPDGKDSFKMYEDLGLFFASQNTNFVVDTTDYRAERFNTTPSSTKTDKVSTSNSTFSTYSDSNSCFIICTYGQSNSSSNTDSSNFSTFGTYSDSNSCFIICTGESSSSEMNYDWFFKS
jgi:hypothetical protein